MGQFNFEETNLICCYRKKTRADTVAAITAALPHMETEIRNTEACRTHSGKAEEADRGRICRACVFAC